MRLGAFVATYNRPATLRSTLGRLLEQTRAPDHVLVVDNGDDTETAGVVHGFGRDRVGYHRMGFNSGPAGACAFGLRTLADQGFDWILCGDDDDPPLTRDTVERLTCLASGGGERLGAVGATGTPWDWRLGTRASVTRLPTAGLWYVDVVSGSKQLMVSRAVVERIGVPNAALFFGNDDFEYCLRIRRAGFEIAVDAALFRDYVALIGRRGKTRPRGSLRPRDEIWRQYYTTRNYIHFMRHEFHNGRLARRETLKAALRIAKSWTKGWEYGASFTRLQARAVLDGYRGRLGLVVPPTPKAEHSA